MIVKYRDVYLLAALRTAIGRFGGAFKDLHPADLAAPLIKTAVESLDLKPSDIDLVVLGHVIRGGSGQLTAKQAVVKAGLPPTIQVINVDHVCASAMEAVHLGALHISYGAAKLVIAGGMECMSYAPLLLPNAFRWGVRFILGRRVEVIDSMYFDGLTDPFTLKPMGEIADVVARKLGVPREELDEIAYESHMRAAKATDAGYFKNEIVPVKVGGTEVAVDEGIRRDTSLDKLAKLKPVFTPEGPHTAGTSSQISDGAAILVLASGDFVKERGFKPIAKILGFSSVDVDPLEFPLAPVPAAKELLNAFSMNVDNIDLFENNEAFAVSTAAYTRGLGVSRSKLNVFGGAIALGHPIGASGARILVTLINALRVTGGRYGLASICHGTGGGEAMLIERI
jgi:acetyl-CoA C-acetyltransferase